MRVSALIAVLIFMQAPAGVAAPPAAVTRFHLAEDGMILVPVTIGTAGPFTFILDTGSNGSSVSERLADRLRLPLVGKGVASSSTGQKEQLFVGLDRVAVGLARAEKLIAGVVADRVLDPTGSVDGVIGQDLLAGWRYTIDFRLGTIAWGGVTVDSPGHTVLGLEAHDDRLLVVLPQGKSTLRLVPDSGAGTLVLFERAGQALPAMRPVDGRYVLATLTGTREVQLSLISELRVGTTTLRNQPAVILGAEPGATEGDGLLPLHFFERVTIDGPNKVMTVEARE